MRVGVTFFQPLPALEMVRLAEVADQLGFDEFLVPDSHMIWRELYVQLGAIARSTSRIGLGPGVTHPLVRHLSVTASAMATLNELAPGRARLGIGVGSSGPATAGVRRTGAAELERSVRAVRELFRGHEVELEGRTLRLGHGGGPDIPIYMAGNSDYTLRSAGRAGDASIFSGPMDGLPRAAALVREGDPARSVPLIWAPPCALSDDGASARDAVKPVVARTALVSLGLAAKRGELPAEDVEPLRRLSEAYDPYKHMSSSYNALVEDRWVDRFALAGTPAHVLEQARRARSAGAGRLFISLHGEDLEQQLRGFSTILAQVQAL